MCYCCLFPLSASTFFYTQKKQLILYYGCFSWREMCLQMSLLTASLSGKLSYKKLCVRTGAFITADLLGYQQCGGAGFLLILSSAYSWQHILFILLIISSICLASFQGKHTDISLFYISEHMLWVSLYSFFNIISGDHCIVHAEFASLKRWW